MKIFNEILITKDTKKYHFFFNFVRFVIFAVKLSQKLSTKVLTR